MIDVTDAEAAELGRLAKKATPAPWDFDVVRNDGEYGSGPNTRKGFDSYKVTDSGGGTLFDTLNSDRMHVHEEWGDEPWDEVGRNNIAYATAACNLSPKLLAERTRLRGEVVQWKARVVQLEVAVRHVLDRQRIAERGLVLEQGSVEFVRAALAAAPATAGDVPKAQPEQPPRHLCGSSGYAEALEAGYPECPRCAWDREQRAKAEAAKDGAA